jgi:DNA-binding transcriptional LysR family regulator
MMQLVDRIGSRLKLRELHILLAVAERGSMAKAAHDLAVSQPVVSKTIADLEATLGVRLLDRSRQGIVPTPYGRALLRRSFAAFDELREGVKEIEFLTKPTTGDVRVGALVGAVAGLLPVVINQVRDRYPRFTVRVTQLLTSPAVYETLRERTVDFIIGRILSRTHEKDLNVQVLFHEPLFIVTGAQSPWASRRKIGIGDLLDEPWILPEPHTEVGSHVAAVFQRSKVEVPRAAVVSNALEMYWALLATGKFLTVLPPSVLHFSVQRPPIKVLPVKLPVQFRPYGVVTLKNRTLSPAAQIVIDCAREVAKPLGRQEKHGARKS